jgi:hypothetical protein
MRKETLSAAVVGSLVTLLVASGLAVSAGAEQPGDGARRGYNRLRLTPTPTPTATLGPSGSVVRVRHGAPPNALVGLSSSFGAGGGADAECEAIPAGITAYYTRASTETGQAVCFPIASGEAIRIQNLSEGTSPIGGDITSDRFPVIRSTVPLLESAVFAESPLGERIRPIIMNHMDYNGTVSVHLPLRAYMEPGSWRLVVTQPAFYEISIEIPHTDAPFLLNDYFSSPMEFEQLDLLIGGFAPLERVKGVFLGGYPRAFTGDFDFQVDADGYALIAVDWIDNLNFIGEYGNAVVPYGFYVDLGRCSTDEWQHAEMSGAEFAKLLYNTYWGGGAPPEIVIASSAANFRCGPGLGFEVVGLGQGGERYPATVRAYDGDNRVWYRILLPDGTTGWISERIVEVVPSADSIPWAVVE